MTPTEIEKINREFAEEVMGWTYDHSLLEWRRQNEKAIVYWYDEDDVRQLPVNGPDAFDPYHRWDHAAMGLKKFEAWLIGKLEKKFVCRIKYRHTKDGINDWSRSEADTALAAICLACIEAKKEE